jgi:uncharacterized damage-inducible protein DinB
MTTPEIEGYITALRALRAEMLSSYEGLDADALNWKPPVKETNSLYQLATHVAGSDAYWLLQVIGGTDIHRDRRAEFEAAGDDMASLRTKIAQNEKASEEVLRRLNESDMATAHDSAMVAHDSRWCILHVIEHWSRHVGHAELTRQLYESTSAGR